jgi:hypothetical protein
VEACRGRKKVEMLFAHLKRILRLARLRLMGPNGPRDEFLLAATAQNLRRLTRLRPTACFRKCWPPNADPSPPQAASKNKNATDLGTCDPAEASPDPGLFNGIRPKRTLTIAAVYVAIGEAARCAIGPIEVCDAAMARDIRKAAQAAP